MILLQNFFGCYWFDNLFNYGRDGVIKNGRGRGICMGTAETKISAWRQSIYHRPTSNIQLVLCMHKVVSFLCNSCSQHNVNMITMHTLAGGLVKPPLNIGTHEQITSDRKVWDIISYPLFADADTGIYPHAASQYHAWPSAARGIAMLSVDTFPYPRKQTKGNEIIPCSNDVSSHPKRFPQL